MTFTDSPDWQEVAVTVSAAGDMPDAPDWQKTVVGPGASPISPPSGNYGYSRLPPGIYGWKQWTYDFALTNQHGSTGDNEVFFTSIVPAQDVTVNEIWELCDPAVGMTFTGTGQLGIYSCDEFVYGTIPNLTKIGETDAATSLAIWNALPQGNLTMAKLPLVSPVSLTAGKMYYMAHLLGTAGQNTVGYTTVIGFNEGEWYTYFYFVGTSGMSLPDSVLGSDVVVTTGPIWAAVS